MPEALFASGCASEAALVGRDPQKRSRKHRIHHTALICTTECSTGLPSTEPAVITGADPRPEGPWKSRRGENSNDTPQARLASRCRPRDRCRCQLRGLRRRQHGNGSASGDQRREPDGADDHDRRGHAAVDYAHRSALVRLDARPEQRRDLRLQHGRRRSLQLLRLGLRRDRGDRHHPAQCGRRRHAVQRHRRRWTDARIAAICAERLRLHAVCHELEFRQRPGRRPLAARRRHPAAARGRDDEGPVQ